MAGEWLYWVWAMAGIIIIFLILWVVSVQRRLTVMNEKVDDTLQQIGVQLFARLAALTALLKLVEQYAEGESRSLEEKVRSCGSMTAVCTPADIKKQEKMITEVLHAAIALAKRYPELKNSEEYARCMDAVDNCEKMVHTSRLIYNDSVARLNRELLIFPTAFVAGMLGFRQRAYLEAQE